MYSVKKAMEVELLEKEISGNQIRPVTRNDQKVVVLLSPSENQPNGGG